MIIKILMYYNSDQTCNCFVFIQLQFVKKLKSYPDSGWSSTHLTNLLHLCDKIEPEFDTSDAM